MPRAFNALTATTTRLQCYRQSVPQAFSTRSNSDEVAKLLDSSFLVIDES